MLLKLYSFSHSGGRQRGQIKTGHRTRGRKTDREVTAEVKRREERGRDVIRHSKGGEEENRIPLKSLPRRNVRLQLRTRAQGKQTGEMGTGKVGLKQSEAEGPSR